MKKRSKWIKIIFISILYIAGFMHLSASAYAEESSGGENPTLGFNYKVIQPENQQNKEVGYFDLRMTPGQKQTVQIELSSATDKDVDVAISLNGAKTNSNGVIEYGPFAQDNDKSLKYDFTDIVKAPETITVPASGTAVLDLEITMPEVSFDGVISGGIQMKKVVDEKARAEQKGVINEYAFMVGMVLKETDTVLQPKLELNKVAAALSNHRNAVIVNLSNSEAAYLENMTLEVQITKKGEETILYETKKSSMRMAPNSLIDFPVLMNGEKMVPGDYRAKITATDGTQKWAWDQEFTITDEEADKYNQQDVTLVQDEGINWVLIAAIAGGMLLLILIIFFVVRTMNKRKANQKKKKSKNPKKGRKND